jgi:hypothetical protein
MSRRERVAQRSVSRRSPETGRSPEAGAVAFGMGTGCFGERGRNAPSDETLLATSVKIYPPETQSFRSGQGGQKRGTRRDSLKRRLHYTTKSEGGRPKASSPRLSGNERHLRRVCRFYISGPNAVRCFGECLHLPKCRQLLVDTDLLQN